MPTLNGSSLGVAAAILALTVADAAPTWAADPERVSVGPGGGQGDGASYGPAFSADGRFVAFLSRATNLVPGDTNGAGDVFVRDLGARATTRVSVGPSGAQAEAGDYPYRPALSANGRYVAFTSDATNLVQGDSNRQRDVFVHDRQTRKTSRASVGSGGVQADGASGPVELSADGRFVAFASSATNLVTGDTNGEGDVFVRDRRLGTTTRVSVGPSGAEGDGASGAPAISADGRYVAFASDAANLVPGDTNRMEDVFVHDRSTGRTTRVSVGPRGAQGNGSSSEPAISADGRYVAFDTSADNLVPGDTNDTFDVLVHDRETRRTTRVSVGAGGVQGEGSSKYPSFSGEGRYVAFLSTAENLAPGDTNGTQDVFIHNRTTGVTRRPSLGPGGVQADGFSSGPALSKDGRLVVFESMATNLVPGDTNGAYDVFLRVR